MWISASGIRRVEPQRLPHHIQVARLTIDVSFAVAAPKLHSEYQKNHLKPFHTQYTLNTETTLCGFPPPDFAGPSHNDCRSHGFLFDAQPESEKTFHIQMVFLILPH